jgi:hypothetical protein
MLDGQPPFTDPSTDRVPVLHSDPPLPKVPLF